MQNEFSDCGNWLTKWQQQGKETAILFGRFQPLNAGQVSLIHLIETTGLDVHIVTNEKISTATEKNPFSREQRLNMFQIALPEITQRQQHFTTVYLDKNGDVTAEVKKLQSVFDSFSVPAKSVIFYVNKPEDVKPYILDNASTPTLHYVDLFLPPYGEMAKQVISPQEIPAANRQITKKLNDYLSKLAL